MSEVKNLTGVITALITPFSKNGDIDFDAMKVLMDFQIDNGVRSVVVCGSTGEAMSMNEEEYESVISFCVENYSKKLSIIAGLSSNNLSICKSRLLFCQKIGVSAVLGVVPYYLRPSQKGIELYFKELLNGSSVPFLIYDVPSRCAVSIEVETVSRVMEIKNVIGIKDASGNLTRVRKIRECAVKLGKKDFIMLSGDDDSFVDYCMLSGDGVISVVSNILPKEMVDICDALHQKDYAKAMEKFNGIQSIISAMSIESNPIPVKFVLYKMGMVSHSFRLPLCQASMQNQSKIEGAIAGLIK
ncbi:4-hydroxy-tetrahydrodipicolinate synthase [Rickettsiales bacterium]|nr:4-hydroxy-tetrahydrodipicolinate synthase [Rickettsiales bacterium]